MELRKLTPEKDAVIVGRLFLSAADYVMLVEGSAPGTAQVAAFFKDVPPGADISQSVKVGLFEGDVLLGIADMAFGYPDEGAAYIGLLLFAPEARGQGFGRAVLALLEEEAQARGMEWVYAAVVEDNARGRAFWLREGYLPIRRLGPVKVGTKVHMIDRMGKAMR